MGLLDRWFGRRQTEKESAEEAERTDRVLQESEERAKLLFQAQLESEPAHDSTSDLEHASALYLKHFHVGLRGDMRVTVPSMNDSYMAKWTARHEGLLAWAAALAGVSAVDLAAGVADAAYLEFLQEVERDRSELNRAANVHTFRVTIQQQQFWTRNSWAGRSAFISTYGSEGLRSECVALGLELQQGPSGSS